MILVAVFLFGSAACVSLAHPIKSRRHGVAQTASEKKAAHRAVQRTARRRAGVEPAVERSTSRSRALRRTISSDSPSPRLRSRAHRATASAAEEQGVAEEASLHTTRVEMPPPLRGSHESLVRQNEKSEEADGLERIEDDDDLAARIAGGMLVPVPVSGALSINGNLPENRRYCRPWTASFLADLARAHAARFHDSLLVTSAVRTVAYQKQLERTNGNAAAAEGDIASPHLTGASIDIAKQGLSRQEIAWMRDRLLPLQEAGKIDVEEEFQQSCFHITVYKSYVAAKPAHTAAAEATTTAPAHAEHGTTDKARPKQSRPAMPKRQRPEPEEQPTPAASQAEAPVEG